MPKLESDYMLLFFETEKHLWYISKSKKITKMIKHKNGKTTKGRISAIELALLDVDAIWNFKFKDFKKEKIKWHRPFKEGHQF